MAFEIDGPTYYFGNIVSPFIKNGNPAINLSDVIEIYNIYNDPTGKYTERVDGKRKWKAAVPYFFRRLSNIVSKPGIGVDDEDIPIPTLSDVIEAYNWFNGSGGRDLSDPDSYGVLIYDAIAPTPTSTSTQTPTPTVTQSNTATPTVTPTNTATPTHTPTYTTTHTNTPSLTVSPTAEILKYLINKDFDGVYQVSDDLNKFKVDYLGYTENLSECPTVFNFGTRVSNFIPGHSYEVGYNLYNTSESANVTIDDDSLRTFTAIDPSREFLNIIKVDNQVEVFVIKFSIKDITADIYENTYFIFRCPEL